MRPPALYAVFVLITAGVAAASPVITTEYGIEFVTVGDAGNRDSRADETAYNIPGQHVPFGGVDYDFRISRTEITTADWFEFVQAYLPYYDSPVPGGGADFLSKGIRLDFSGNNPRMAVPSQLPVEVSWSFAARYANWLHNDKAADQWAFESGAYDTSTFELPDDPNSPYAPQVIASPGARFRLPSPDEWVKAVYWDPAKDGDGGYWPFPYASDTPTLGSEPGGGGMSDIGQPLITAEGFENHPVGSFPLSSGPWGVFDVSGSMTEMLQADPRFLGTIPVVASARGSDPSADSLDFAFRYLSLQQAVGSIGTDGFRLVSPVPGPASWLVAGAACIAGRRYTNRRRA